MDGDFIFVIGLVIVILSIPSIFSALVDGRPPRAAAIILLIGGGLVGLAIYRRPGAYTFESTPDVILGVISRLF